jgi:hypothetical protein
MFTMLNKWEIFVNQIYLFNYINMPEKEIWKLLEKEKEKSEYDLIDYIVFTSCAFCWITILSLTIVVVKVSFFGW